MILAIDIGTTMAKGALVSPDGNASFLTRVFTDLTPKDWIRAIKIISASISSHKNKITGIAISGNGPTLVAVDDAGQPLDRPISWMEKSRPQYNEEILTKTEGKFRPDFYLAKIFQSFKEKNDLYGKTAHFLPCPEFLNFYLTGEARTILFSEKAHPFLWTPWALDRLDLEQTKFPPFIKPGEIVGKLTHKIADELNLPPGLPVIACGTDFLMSIIGTGTIEPGKACDRAGTSEGLNLCSIEAIDDKRLLLMPHIREGFYNISGILSTSGKALEWVKNVTYSPDTGYDTIYKEITKAAPGAGDLIFLPFLHTNRTSLWGDIRGTFTGLTLAHGKPEILRAVFESTGYAINDIINTMEEQNLKIETITVTGGQSRFQLWNQVRADITGRVISVPTIPDSELIGAAILGFIGTGVYKNLVDAARGVVKIKNQIEPNPENHKIYQPLYAKYREALKQIQGI